MIFFNAIIKNRNNNPSPSVSIVPCRYNIHVKATGTALQSKETFHHQKNYRSGSFAITKTKHILQLQNMVHICTSYSETCHSMTHMESVQALQTVNHKNCAYFIFTITTLIPHAVIRNDWNTNLQKCQLYHNCVVIL